MCPFWPFHYVLLLVLLISPLFFLINTVSTSSNQNLWNVSFSPFKIFGLKMTQVTRVNFTTSDYTNHEFDYGIVKIVPSDNNIIDCAPSVLNIHNTRDENRSWSAAFNVKGKFLGTAEIRLVLQTTELDGSIKERESSPIPVSIVRPERLIDKVFTISVAVLVSVIFVNFGCALDWDSLRENLKRPIGPVIGFVSQFLFMPLIAFTLGKLLFKDSVAMQLGLFFTGVSPGGGASNVWIYMLGGNINLSITMTAVSTLAAFVMMPLWTFTLGRQIFSSGSMAVPYSRIASFAIALVVPLAVGFMLQRLCPRISKVMVKILKPFSGLLIVFIIIFASITNLYLFELFTWQIILAGIGLPWFGYIFGWIFSKMFRLSPEDSLAISVETGVQNTGIAIFMLRFSLAQPEADLTTVVPVAVALMTPIPLTIWYCIKKFMPCNKTNLNEKIVSISNGELLPPSVIERSFSYTLTNNS